MSTRPALLQDIDAVTETITLAFADDPVWGVALAGVGGSTAHHAAYWRCFIEGALRYSTVFMEDDASAVSVWLPPGGTELSAAQETDCRRLVEGSLGANGARALFELWERFALNQPDTEPYAYLSLLATHPDHRGRGVGQRLLADDLARWDLGAVPAYLESTNPANDHRYERFGFQRIGSFGSVIDDAPISTMWRPTADR